MLAAPVEADELDFTIGVTSEIVPDWAKGNVLGKLPWKPLDAMVVRFMLGTVVHDVLQDEPIWAHRRPLARPDLVPGDGPIGKFRRWASQFHS